MMMWFVITEKNLWRGEVNQTQALDTHPYSVYLEWVGKYYWLEPRHSECFMGKNGIRMGDRMGSADHTRYYCKIQERDYTVAV